MPSFSTAGLQEAIEEFFFATLPSQERWDEWKDYRILVHGGAIEDVSAAVARFVNGR